MIETKIIVRQKGVTRSGTAVSSGGGIGMVTDIDHALTADKAKKAEVADTANYANSAGYASRAGYANKAGEIDEDSEVLARILKKYLRKDIDDTAEGTVTFKKVQKMLQGLLVGDGYRFGADGDITSHDITSHDITSHDITSQTDTTDELKALVLATIAQLKVKGDSVFDGALSSPYFVSGFLAGKGWRIKNTPVENAAGVLENKYTEEIDNLIVRGSMRVFEMVISQLLGENDNRIFTAMLEVDHYDPESGKVYLDTREGRYYNPFRKDDYIMVQQYNGMPSAENNHYVTKNYELIVTEVGSEGTGEDMLAWVRFRNFTCSMEGATPEELITKKDTFVRVDNLTDPDRKGIIQMMTVGSDTPYMDIIHGLKTDPDNALKGRLGNLGGIVHPLFGKLRGFGEYLNNLYAVGDLMLRRTGESIDTKFQMLENMFSTRFSQTTYDLSNDANYLENGQFLQDVGDTDNSLIKGWNVDSTDETQFWVDASGMPVMVNGQLTVSGNRKVGLELNDGKKMLRIQNCGVTQRNADIRKPGTHKEYVKPSSGKDADGMATTGDAYVDVQDTLYVSVKVYAKTAGTLTVGFEGYGDGSDGIKTTLGARNFDLAYSGEWELVKMEGVWSGQGYFVLRYTGDCYISLVSVTDEPLSNLEKTVGTQIQQTATNIKLLGENIDKVNGTATHLGIELDAEKKEIRSYVDTSVKDATGEITTNYRSELKQTASEINSRVEEAQSTADGAVKSFSELKQTVGEIQLTVSGKVDSDAYDKANKALSDAVNTAQATANQAVSDAANAEKNAKAYTQGQIDLTNDKLNAFVGKVTFDDAGNIKNINTSGLVTTASYSGLFSQYMADNKLVTSAQIATFITEDQAGNIVSNATIQADHVNLSGHTMAFSGSQITIDTSNFKLDSAGNVTMRGAVTATSGKIGCLSISSDGTLSQHGMRIASSGMEFRNTVSDDWSTSNYYFKINTKATSKSIAEIHGVDCANGALNVSASCSEGQSAIPIAVTAAGGTFDAITCNSGMFSGFRPRCRTGVTSNVTLNHYDNVVHCENSSQITVFLPKNPYCGQMILIIQHGTGNIVISGNGQKVWAWGHDGDTTFTSGTRYQFTWCFYDGTYWDIGWHNH